MDAKASKMSQRSATQDPRMGKTASKVSVTPSQMSERTRLNMSNMNKDPLDALSRLTQRQLAERRCGLQDVDDDYLKNVYAYAGRKQFEAAQRSEVRADMMPAGVPTMRAGQQRSGNQQTAGAQKAGQQEPSPNQQQNAESPVAQEHIAQEKMMSNQPAAAAVAAQNQEAAQSQPQQNASPGNPAQTAGPIGSSVDPELYTTCPNCRATLYLVRNAGDPSPYGVQATQQNQQQQQQQKLGQQGNAAAAVPVQQ